MFQLITESVPIAGFGSALVLGLIIGLRHSTDGDHIVAVSTMARDYQSLFKGLWVGVSWGLGHSTPLLILGIITTSKGEIGLVHFIISLSYLASIIAPTNLETPMP